MFRIIFFVDSLTIASYLHYFVFSHVPAQDPTRALAAKSYTYVKPARPEDARYPAHFWTPEYLKKTPFAEALFRLGDDDDGETLRAKLKVFLQYMRGNKDDSPLYLFEDSLDRCAISKPILSLYRVPSFFRQVRQCRCKAGNKA